MAFAMRHSMQCSSLDVRHRVSPWSLACCLRNGARGELFPGSARISYAEPDRPGGFAAGGRSRCYRQGLVNAKWISSRTLHHKASAFGVPHLVARGLGDRELEGTQSSCLELCWDH